MELNYISDNLRNAVSFHKYVVLVDYSWCLHRYAHVFKNLTAGEGGRATGHIYGMLQSIMSIRKGYPDSVIILCQDGVPVERISMFNTDEHAYKEGRPELEYDFYADIPIINALSFLAPDVYLAYHPQKESDDCMYALAKQITTFSNAKVFIYSGDNDLLQAIGDNISVVRHFNKDGQFEEITEEVLLTDPKLSAKFGGTSASKLPYFRAIKGDTSDKMHGVPRFPTKLAATLANSANSLEDVFTNCPYPQRDKMEEYRDTVELNYKMMKLEYDWEVPLSRRFVKKDKVLAVAQSFRLNSYINFLKSHHYI